MEMISSVYISDPTWHEINAMQRFIAETTLDVITIDGVDVSDVSLTADVIYEYRFSNEQDALMFSLRWKK